MTYVVAQDCMDFMKSLSDNSVDLLLFDPPYAGIVEDSWDNQWKSNDDYVNWILDLLRLAKPKMKETGSVIFFGGLGKHNDRPFFKTILRIEEENLFHYRNMITWGKRRAYGKALALNTELPTPKGFIKLADLKEGDQLFDENGKICNVIKLHPIDQQPKSYRLFFDDKTHIDACGDHLWATHTRRERKNHQPPSIKTTEELFQTIKSSNGETNHSIANCQPVNCPTQKLPIDPYLLGLWLGDGTSSSGCITSADSEIFVNYEHHVIPCTLKNSSKSKLYRIAGLTTKLRNLGVLNNKHIPEIYLRSSIKQRMALLQGLMDTDGCCLKIGQAEFCSVIEKLATQTQELMASLGLKPKIYRNESWLKGRRCQDRYRVTCITDKPIFKLARKLKNLKLVKVQKTRNTHRYIHDIQPIESVPMRCVTVDSPSHLFLVTRSYIPTHNSHDYLFTREEIVWYSVSPERTKVTFNIPYTNTKRGYAGFDKNHPAKSEFLRVSNVWTDITELFKTERNCQKPLPLMKRLIETHSNPGDLVVDPFVGYGSTGMSALALGRQFLGCEKIEADAEAANKRCQNLVQT